MCIRDATFIQEPITCISLHHHFANSYQQLLADLGSLPANLQHLYDFHYKGCLLLPTIYRRLVYLAQITAGNEKNTDMLVTW